MGGILEVKEHSFFNNLDWENMLKQKAELVSSLYGKGLEDAVYVHSKWWVKLASTVKWANLVPVPDFYHEKSILVCSYVWKLLFETNEITELLSD